MSAFNWNRKRKGTHALDPYGVTRTGIPLKRKPAATLLDELKNVKGLAGAIESTAHVGLRKLLQKSPDLAAHNFVRWLQETTLAGLKNDQMGRHPADVARKQLLKTFAESTVEAVVAGTIQIPSIIGVRCVNHGVKGKIEITRIDQHGKVFQHYQTEPAVRELIVGYQYKDGALDRAKPVVFVVNQLREMRRQIANKQVPLDLSSENPLKGRSHGSAESRKIFDDQWEQALKSFCDSEGLNKVFRITQGCLIEKMDGTVFQFRNFDKSQPWMKDGPFKDIRRVRRSPLQKME